MQALDQTELYADRKFKFPELNEHNCVYTEIDTHIYIYITLILMNGLKIFIFIRY